MKKLFFIFLILFPACGVLRKSNDTITLKPNNDLVSITRSDNPLLYMQSDTLIPLSKYKGDTADYIRHNFIENKQKYVGKELNTLLKDLGIPIKSYMFEVPWNNNDSIPCSTLQFQSFKEVCRRIDNREKPANIIIQWKHCLPYDSIMKRGVLNKFNWTAEDYRYYGKQIVGDVLQTLW